MAENHLDSRVFVYLTEILAKPIREAASNKIVGRPFDVTVKMDEAFPPITGFLLRSRGRLLLVPGDQVRETASAFILEGGQTADLKPYVPAEGQVCLRQEILDRQIIDTIGVRVVRVNDLHFVRAKGAFNLIHVDVGMSGIFRRLRWTRAVNFLAQALFDYTPKDHLISWKYVHPLPSGGPEGQRKVLRLSVKQGQLAQLHPADLAELLEDLDLHKREMVFQALSPEVAADALEQMDTKTQVDLIETMDEDRATRVVEEMAADEAADLLAELDEAKAEHILEEMEEERSDEVRELLAHPEHTAGGLMTTDYLALRMDLTVDEAIATLRREAQEAESINYLYAVDDRDHLMGVVTLRSLIVAKSETRLEDIMIKRVVSVKVEEHKKAVAEVFSKYRFRALPVVDDDGVLKGMVTVDDAVEAVAPEFGR